MTRHIAAALLPLLVACDGEPTAPAAAASAWTPTPVFHDFGVIGHGDKVTRRLAIDVPAGRGPLTAAGYQGDCSCASYGFVATTATGRERILQPSVDPAHALRPDESLLLELTLDTSRKEALEQKPVTSTGRVALWLIEPGERLLVPVSFTYGIDAPVRIEPFAHIDFGRLPQSRAFEVLLRLYPKTGTRLAFGPASCSDDRIAVELHPAADGAGTDLEVRVRPDRAREPAPLYAEILIGTDRADGYEVRIPVSGQIVSDIEVVPMERISFGRLPLDQPAEGFVNLRDYDEERPATFVVQRVRTVIGRALEQHVHPELQPIDGDPRGARLLLRYAGTYRATRAFRGFVDLGKEGVDRTLVSIEFVGFGDDARNP